MIKYFFYCCCVISLFACETSKKTSSNRLYDYKIIDYSVEDSMKNKRESHILNDSLNILIVRADLNDLKIALHLKSYLTVVQSSGLKYTNELRKKYLDENPMLLLINDTIRDFNFIIPNSEIVLPRSISSIKKGDKVYIQICLDVILMTSNNFSKPYLSYVILLELDKNGVVISSVASLATRKQIGEEDFFRIILEE